MTTVVVDASVWVSALITVDGNHIVSQAWVVRWRQAGNGFAGPLLFLVEVGCAIGRQPHQSDAARTAVSDIVVDVSFNLLPIDQALAERAADVGITARLRGADALYVAVAQQLGIPLVTWDTELLIRAADVGVAARVPTV